jgi:hypothetical protein
VGFVISSAGGTESEAPASGAGSATGSSPVEVAAGVLVPSPLPDVVLMEGVLVFAGINVSVVRPRSCKMLWSMDSEMQVEPMQNWPLAFT